MRKKHIVVSSSASGASGMAQPDSSKEPLENNSKSSCRFPRKPHIREN